MKKLVVAVLVVASGILTWWFLAGQSGQLPATEGAEASSSTLPPQSRLPEVAVMTVRVQTIAPSEELPGRVSAYRFAQIRPQVSGIVIERHFEEGANVQAGDMLYQIDPALYQVAVESAQARVMNSSVDIEQAELRARRFAELRDSEAISQQELDNAKVALDKAKAGLALAQAELNRAELNLEYTRIAAPISGRIGRSYVTEGALVTTGQSEAMAIVTQLDPIFVDLSQSSAEHMRWRGQTTPEQEIRVSLDLGEGRYAQQGQLQFSDVLIDPSTSSVQMRAQFPNPDAILLPGLFVTARLHLGTRQEILIPQQALSRNADGTSSVWVLSDADTVTPVTVQAGRATGDHWLIEDGLDEGDTIVVEGFQRIGPGMSVSPVQMETP